MSSLTKDFDFDRCRAKAMKCAEVKNEFYQLACKAYKSGNKQRAKTLSNTGKMYARLQTAANEKAAQEIFDYFNPPEKRSVDKIDLHGLFVSEAIEYLVQHIALAQERGHRALIVIVGRGIHSEGGARIKPAVIMYAEEENIRYQVDLPNVGCIRLVFHEPRIIYSHVARIYEDYSPAQTYENYSPARRIETDHTKKYLILSMFMAILLAYGPVVAVIIVVLISLIYVSNKN